MTFVTPWEIKASNEQRPIHPAPKTTAVWPTCASPWLAAWKPTASGSINAPSNVETLSGNLKHKSASCATYSWKTPSTGGVAKKITSGHKLYFPWRQNSQWPHVLPGSNATRSPTFKCLTFLPTSVTTPPGSWPRTNGGLTI